MTANLRSSRAMKRPAIAVSLLALLIIAACTPAHPQSTFGASGPVAQDQKNIYLLIFWIASAVFVLVEGALIYSVLRYRRRRRSSELPEQTHGNNRLEIAWTIAPALILVVIAIPTVNLIFSQNAGPVKGDTSENPVRISVVGHQWWWEVAYTDEDVVSANEVHIPVGEPVLVQLASDDVVHSFWVPKLGGKVDLIPNHSNHLWLQANEPGIYLGQCAEFCGEGHALMRFRVVAQARADYDAWLAGMRRPAAPPEAGSDAEKGAALFARNCSMCHSTRTYETALARSERTTQSARQAAFRADPEGARIIAAPDLTHLATRLTIGAGLAVMSRENLEKWVQDPRNIKRATRMRKLAAVYDGGPAKLGSEEVSQIVDYLWSLKPVPPEAVANATLPPPVPADDPIARGRALFQAQGCSGCHLTGSGTLAGPGLGGLKDRAGGAVSGMSAEEYVRASIVSPAAYVVQGFSPIMPTTFGASMSDEEISDLIAYLLSLE